MSIPGGARGVRLSDADQELAIADLKEHSAAGRLSMDELSERVARVYEAHTFGEIADLMADLPELPLRREGAGRATGPAPTRKPVIPGVAPFSEMLTVARPPAEVRAEVLRLFAPRLARYGYELVRADPGRLEFELNRHPGWAIAAGLVTLPIGGFLLFFYKRKLTIRLELEPVPPAATRLVVSGSAPMSVRRAFAELGE